MTKGIKTGGRKAGTPNRRTADVAERLRKIGCDPILGMARIAMLAEAEGDLALAGRTYADLAPYLEAKRKAVEIIAPSAVASRIEVTFVKSPEEAYRDMLDASVPMDDRLI